MTTSAWLLGAFTVILGAAVSLAGEWARRRWLRADAKIERRLVRSEAAAREALMLIRAIEDRLRRCRSTREVPDQKEMLEMTRPMRDAALLIGDGDVRARLESIATVAEQLHGVEAMGGFQPHRVAAALSTAGRNAVAHVLSDEPLMDPSPISEYTDLVEEEWRLMEEARAEE